MRGAPSLEPAIPLEAKSPFELRVDLSKNVPQSAVKEALETGDTGFLHSFTTGSAVDGPGLRLVAWTAGCQFKCRYCHNPDTWNMMNGMPVPLERAVDEIKKYRHGLRVMSGGFTISGGEPLMQDRFVIRLLTAAKEMNVHTAIDTNGYLGERLTDEELQQIDLVLLCIKSLDAQRHLELVGKELGPSLNFARRLADLKRPMWLRYVLLPGWTDSDADIEKMATFISGLGNCKRVDMMPFHQLGKFKWERLGLEYTLGDVEPPSAEAVEHACKLFRAAGLVAH
jgi:pyruvate formate lyase activating enzyme